MKINPITPITRLDADLYEKEMNQRANSRTGAPKMTMQRVIEHAKEFDPSFVYNPSNNDIPTFLYNSKGLIQK